MLQKGRRCRRARRQLMRLEAAVLILSSRYAAACSWPALMRYCLSGAKASIPNLRQLSTNPDHTRKAAHLPVLGGRLRLAASWRPLSPNALCAAC